MSEELMNINTKNDILDVNQVISNVDSFIRKEYLCELKDAQIVPIPSRLSEIGIGKNVRLFKLSSIAYSSEGDIYDKIVSIYSALSGFDTKQVLILDSDGYNADLYMGVASESADNLGMEFETFKGSFIGNFPGGRISVLNNQKNEKLLNDIFDEPNIRISSVSALTTLQEHSGKIAYGIERLVDGMYGKPFTMVLLSDSVTKSELSNLRKCYESMYTELSPFRQYSLSLNNNISESTTKSFNLTKSESLTTGKNITQSSNFGKTSSKTVTTAPDNREADKKRAKNQLIGSAVSVALTLSGLGAAKESVKIGKDLLSGLFYGGSISTILNSANSLLYGAGTGGTEAVNDSESQSTGFSESETSSKQEGFSASEGVSDGSTHATGKNIQMSYENKSISNLLEVLDRQIKRIQHIEEIGGFSCATYFITGDNTTAHTVSNMYKSLLGSGNSLCQSNAINVWSEKDSIDGLRDYLKRLSHPVFHFEKRVGFPTFNATSIVSADEFPMYASLPNKSLCGLPVATRAEFARDIYSGNTDEKDKLEIGRIFHMGRDEFRKVQLSKQSLRGHMFVAGTTGMGKSNFCYGLLDGLYKNNVKFMVVEPAKAEYHRVFGGLSDVYTFGTNPNLMPLLRINPFSFPEGIHVNEHIDKLLEIFSSCWPMYAAMPAVLKESIETVYKNCGYNLVTGRCKQPGRFPSFADLLDIMPQIVNKSQFSAEVKGNYIGSLVTRVESLTDGLYGSIFTADEIDNRLLFDENVLIDLSRVGSSETKALIMGLLVMKLQEYRMTTSQMNMPLKHITVLEEAHHLLKASTGSSAEGVNLRAMSLEMLTNAIAEMRTYGEGFVIADQSPSLMDSSVIRNTNTKVIFKLQESTDRQTIGNALSLSANQVNELSRLECGVAVVYQGNWDNPVLSKINYFDSSEFRPYVADFRAPEIDGYSVRSQFTAMLLKSRLSEDRDSSFDCETAKDMVLNSACADDEDREYISIIGRYLEEGRLTMRFSQVCMYTDSVIDSKALMEHCGSCDDVAAWMEKAKEYISERVSLTDDEMKELILLCVNIRANDSQEIRKFYFRLFAYMKKA